MSLGIVQILILVVIIGVIATPFIIAKTSKDKKISRGEPVENLPPYKWGYVVAVVVGGINGSLILISSLTQLNIIGIIIGILLLGIGYGIFQRYRYAWIAAIVLMGFGWIGSIMELMNGEPAPALASLAVTSLFLFYSSFYLYSRWQEFHPFNYRYNTEDR